MGKTFLKRIGNLVAAGLTAASLATGIATGTARASNANWASISEIVPNAGAEQSIAYTSTSSTFLPNLLSAICYIVVPEEHNSIHAIGGFDMQNGVVIKSYYNGDWNSITGYGLNSGDITSTGVNPNNSYQTVYRVFYDKNGDGGFGPIVGGNPGPTTEMLDPSHYTISGFTPYGSANPGSFTFQTDIVPEPSNLALLGVSATMFAFFTNVTSISVQAEPVNCRFYVHVCTNLTTAHWFDAIPGGCIATSAVTVVTHTNTAPQAFYRASSQPAGAP